MEIVALGAAAVSVIIVVDGFAAETTKSLLATAGSRVGERYICSKESLTIHDSCKSHWQRGYCSKINYYRFCERSPPPHSCRRIRSSDYDCDYLSRYRYSYRLNHSIEGSSTNQILFS